MNESLCLRILSVAIIFALPNVSPAKIVDLPRTTTNMIVIHAFGGFECRNGKWTHFRSPKNLTKAIDFLSRNDTAGGAHFVIAEDGTYLASTKIENIAYHVYGRRKGDKIRYNERAIGIELLNDGDGKDVYEDAQLNRLVELLTKLSQDYSIPETSIKLHSELDTREVECGDKSFRRKVDPGPMFPLKEVINKVYKNNGHVNTESQ